MEKPLASLIISVYDNVEFLKCVLDSVNIQTDKRFEVIISEDAEHSAMRAFIESYKFNGTIFHLSQPDNGWQKNKALNKAALLAHTNQLVFIDGDCVLHPRFMEFHIKMFHENHILAGKRIKLDEYSTNWIMGGPNRIENFQKYLHQNFFKLKKRGALFLEEGLFIDPHSILGFIPKLRTMYQLKGCNMSFSKKALYDINGFDEDYTMPAIGEDIDLVWRFRGKGYRLKSIRNLAVQYHLFHKENWNNQDENVEMMLLKKEKQLYYCKNGLSKE